MIEVLITEPLDTHKIAFYIIIYKVVYGSQVLSCDLSVVV